MLKPIDPNAIVPYILECDRDDEKPTIFHIKPMTYRASLEVTSGLTFNRNGEFKVDEDIGRREKLFTSHVAKIENWLWPDKGEPVTVETDTDKAKAFAMLSVEHGQEIMSAIQNESSLTEGEAKN